MSGGVVACNSALYSGNFGLESLFEDRVSQLLLFVIFLSRSRNIMV